jgi:hypothetical protein
MDIVDSLALLESEASALVSDIQLLTTSMQRKPARHNHMS